jgi:hypothetical protein
MMTTGSHETSFSNRKQYVIFLLFLRLLTVVKIISYMSLGCKKMLVVDFIRV